MNLRNSAATLPGIDLGKTYATYPVWAGSTREPVKFYPLAGNRDQSRRTAARLCGDAWRFEAQTRGFGMSQGCIIRMGKLGLSGLAVFYALTRFLNHGTGRIDPSHEAIARKACVSVRTVGRALARLKAAGIINWIKRCSASYDDRRYVLSQDTNAYFLNPVSQWKGYKAPPEPPPPDRDALGLAPRPPHEGAQAFADQAAGLFTTNPIAELAAAKDRLAAMRAKHARKP